MRAEGAPRGEGLERFTSPGKGRGLRARQRFAPGELLFGCPAYTCVLTVSERGNHCECCFARKEGLSKCGRCKQAFYCNVECQDQNTLYYDELSFQEEKSSHHPLRKSEHPESFRRQHLAEELIVC